MLHISAVCLDPSSKKGAKATLMVKSGETDEQFAVCTLREGGTESVTVDLATEEYMEFSVVGNASVHLTVR